MPALPPKPRQPSQPPIVSAFTLSTSEAPRSAAQDAAHLETFAAQSVARALSHAGPSSLAQKLAWVEKLSAGATPLETVREAAGQLDQATYEDLLEERWMEGLCPYPACGEAASLPYRCAEERAADAGRLRVKMRANGLFDASSAQGGREDKEAYCSIRCRRRSEWLRGVVGREGTVELLEDVEGRREAVARSTRELLAEQSSAPTPTPPAAPSADSPSAPPPPDDAKEAFASSLLSTLSIHEKPTTSTPIAPTPGSAAHDFERRAPAPAAANPSSASSSRFPSAPAPRAGSSAALPSPASALLPFSTHGLTRTILRSTSSLPPPPPSRQPTRGLNGLPPIRFLSEPRMLDERGREVEWVGVDEEGETEEVRRLVEEGLRVKRMVERGEL
ncbi:hypothetical protein JCM10213_007528 [Rhodosporidiobolus nylandii]